MIVNKIASTVIFQLNHTRKTLFLNDIRTFFYQRAGFIVNNSEFCRYASCGMENSAMNPTEPRHEMTNLASEGDVNLSARRKRWETECLDDATRALLA